MSKQSLLSTPLSSAARPTFSLSASVCLALSLTGVPTHENVSIVLLLIYRPSPRSPSLIVSAELASTPTKGDACACAWPGEGPEGEEEEEEVRNTLPGFRSRCITRQECITPRASAI